MHVACYNVHQTGSETSFTEQCVCVRFNPKTVCSYYKLEISHYNYFLCQRGLFPFLFV